MIRTRRIAGVVVTACMSVAACRDTRNPPASDTAVLQPPTQPTPPLPTVNPGWDSTSGPALFLGVSESPHRALVVLPALTDSALAASRQFDVGRLSGLPVDLFSRRGKTGTGVIAVDAQDRVMEGCLSWPVAQLSGGTSGDWRIALERGRAAGIRLDSLEGLSPADSADLARQITSVASTIHTKSDSVFVGLPFAVRHAYRFTLGRSVVVFSDVVRKIAAEANPREERLVLVLERPEGGSFTAAYQSRSAGPEEELQITEMLAVVSFTSDKQPGMFLSSEYEDGGKIILLQRTGNAQWRSVWRSAYTGC